MTIEELKQHCVRQITEFERIKEIMPVTPNDYKRYEEHKIVLQLIEALGQECSKYAEYFVSGQQQPCEDCISREAVYDFIRNLPKWCVKSEDGKFSNVGFLYDDVMFGIDKLPSVAPKEKTGWHIAHGMYENRFCCSCGFIKVMDSNMTKWKHCPVCGGERMGMNDGDS